jgi:hypothetical protein
MTKPTPESPTDNHASKLTRLNVKSWPDLLISGWSKWGFDVTEVLRAPRYHFIFNREQPEAYLSEGPDPPLIIKGRWYLLDYAGEKQMLQMAWPSYIIGLVLFAGLLQTAYTSNGIFTILFFILMYTLFEGFVPYALNVIAGKTMKSEVVIPVEKIFLIGHIVKQGVMMIGWDENGVKRGVAMRLTVDGANLAVKMISDISPVTRIVSFSTETLSKPPSQTTRR